jgi:hypothetical protein
MSLQAECGPERVAIRRPGAPTPLLVQNAPAHRRPFIHPLAAPDGAGELTEDMPAHHPWQRGLYVGLNDVGGVGFWKEGTGAVGETDGTFHPAPLAAPRLEGKLASWEVYTQWQAPGGAPVLEETQAWCLRDEGGFCELELAWTLRALRPARFGQYPYGGLFLRMPYREEQGGTALSSEGLGFPLAEGRPARWVALSMPLPGRRGQAGVAMLDHPGNPGHPVSWRVDNQLGLAPSRCIGGDWSLDQGESTTSRYRLYLSCGPIDPEAVAAQWRAFAAT